MINRNEIIEHFKRLADNAGFIHYAAESAERIGWALEVNLRDAAGRVILSLGSEPREHWSPARVAAERCDISESEARIQRAVAGLRALDDGGSGHPLRWGSLGQVDGHLIHRNATSDGTGPARAARQARAEAVSEPRQSAFGSEALANFFDDRLRKAYDLPPFGGGGAGTVVASANTAPEPTITADLQVKRSTLPWKPIAELPVAPDSGREFVVVGARSSWIIHWNGDRWDDGCFGYSQSHTVTLDTFTHFIEITPPSVAPSTPVDTTQAQQ